MKIEAGKEYILQQDLSAIMPGRAKKPRIQSLDIEVGEERFQSLIETRDRHFHAAKGTPVHVETVYDLKPLTGNDIQYVQFTFNCPDGFCRQNKTLDDFIKLVTAHE